jgi:hypothetical protein
MTILRNLLKSIRGTVKMGFGLLQNSTTTNQIRQSANALADKSLNTDRRLATGKGWVETDKSVALEGLSKMESMLHLSEDLAHVRHDVVCWIDPWIF